MLGEIGRGEVVLEEVDWRELQGPEMPSKVESVACGAEEGREDEGDDSWSAEGQDREKSPANRQ